MNPTLKLKRIHEILGKHDDNHHAADNLLGAILALDREMHKVSHLNPVIKGTLERVHRQLKEVYDVLHTPLNHERHGERFPHVTHHEEPQQDHK